MTSTIIYILLITLAFSFGAIFTLFLLKSRCSGYILLYEDQMYLELTKEDCKKLCNKDYVTLNVERVNFKPYIDN